MRKKVLELKKITKIYKIYKSNFDRLKELFFSKVYHKEFIANKDITFDLYEGETLGIIGVNGAGKSTVLKIIVGVTDPTYGTVIKHGRVTALLELGTGFHQELSGYENIYLNGTLIGMSKKEVDQKIDDIIAFSELDEYINEPILTYSSGMTMRLAFSIAIFSEPKILIVDEALSVGDAHFQQKCMKALKKRKEQQMSIIYVSHDLNSLKVLCDRVILLNHGEMSEEGNPEDVVNSYNFLISKLNEENENIKLINKETTSYGNFKAKIDSIEIKGEKSKSAVITSGELATISVKIKSEQLIENVTIGILIRDKFGQDIFGTNTHYHNQDISLKEHEEYICNFTMPLNIGIGKYTITAALHTQENHLDNCFHWLDKGGNFDIAGIKGEIFAGLCRLEPKITFSKQA